MEPRAYEVAIVAREPNPRPMGGSERDGPRDEDERGRKRQGENRCGEVINHVAIRAKLDFERSERSERVDRRMAVEAASKNQLDSKYGATSRSGERRAATRVALYDVVAV